MGSAALFFLLQPRVAILSDACPELCETFKAVRDDVSAVLRYLAELEPGANSYYQIREHRSTGRFKRAAEFIYLNKMCWNGLYRVNASGKFNVPYGRPKTDNVVDEKNIRACSALLRHSAFALETADFEVTASQASRGDLVFLDPPYVMGHRNNGFIDYNEILFSWEDQMRLASLAQWLRRRGCFVILTNADHESISELYTGFTKVRFERKSTIASQALKRGRTTEIILVGAP